MIKELFAFFLVFATLGNAFEITGDETTQTLSFEHYILQTQVTNLSSLVYQAVNHTDTRLFSMERIIADLQNSSNNNMIFVLILFLVLVLITVALIMDFYFGRINKKMEEQLNRFIQLNTMYKEPEVEAEEKTE